MQIVDLTSGQPFTFLIVANEQKLEFSSSVIESLPRKHMILATPVIKDNKIINFHGVGFIVHIIVALPDQKPQIFQNVDAYTAKLKDDSLCYFVKSTTESKELNRRGAFRCFIGIDTSARIGTNHSTIEVTIKDVSISGFSFTCSSETDLQENENVHLVLNDYIEETAKNYSFHLFGTIVRSFQLENGKYVFGCKLISKIVGLDKYIMEKERIRLQRNRRSNSYNANNKK